MNLKHIGASFLAATLGVGTPSALSQNSCQKKPLIAGFFNGATNSRDTAVKYMARLKAVIGDTSPDGRPIDWQLFYNTSEGENSAIRETFKLRMEQDPDLRERWELLTEAVQQQTNVASGTLALIYATVGKLTVLDDLYRDVLGVVLKDTANDANIVKDVEGHKKLIKEYADQGSQFLMLSHSQGSLYAYPSHEYAVSLVGDDNVRSHHIAPVSSLAKMYGTYTLADHDSYINLLRTVTLMDVAGSNVEIPENAADRPPGKNVDGVNAVDSSGHSLLLTYLVDGMEPRGHIIEKANTALDELSQRSTSNCTNITSATCELVDVVEDGEKVKRASWTMYGTAAVDSADVKDVLIVAPSFPIYVGSLISTTCDKWTGVSYFYGVPSCARKETDPLTTNFVARAYSPGDYIHDGSYALASDLKMIIDSSAYSVTDEPYIKHNNLRCQAYDFTQ